MEFTTKPCVVVLENCTPKKQAGLSTELHNEIQKRNVFTTRTKQKILRDLDTIQVADVEHNRKLQRNKIASEILSSEVTYVNKLKIIEEFFMKPIEDGNILSTEDYVSLFGNIKTLQNVSKELLQNLKKNESVVEAFEKIVPFFKHYSVYGYHYKQSLNLLQILSRKNTAFIKLLDMQESRPEVQSKLSALLITPIQRVPRYCLLLGNNFNSSTNPMEFTTKPCVVVLENCTPKKQAGLSTELHNEIQKRNVFTTRTKQKILRDLDTIQVADVEHNRKLQRNKIASEILSSEVTYVNKLKIIEEFFMKPIEDGNILSTEDYVSLFGNIKTLQNVSKELLQNLKKNESVVEAFEKIVPFFKHYSVYGYHYKQSLNLLQILSRKNTAFIKLLDMQESRPEVQSKLSALLITPIQRVPRYCLLLQQLHENTAASDSSYFQLTELLKKVESTAMHINSLIEDQENAQLMLEFQRSLVHNFPTIVRPGRKLIKKGILTVVDEFKAKKQKRLFVLMTDIIMFCKLKKADTNIPNSLKCSGILPLNKCKIIENLSKGAFTINCEDETVVAYHEHAHEAEEWVKVINERIKEYILERRSLRKDSSARRPAVDKKKFNNYQEVGVSPGIPRRKRFLRDDNLDGNHSEKKFELRVCKRKCIRNVQTSNGQDCLFPLRELHKNHTDLDENCDTKVDKDTLESNDDNKLFVFGANNRPRGFRFGMMSMLTGIGSSFKKLFGLRN
ncbi:hypothetical protein FQR65_LT14616 [Abscondita terminalis]|nr:hypothetical protein FQR65_LT14616 [Abscondita terminalis]